MLAKSRTPHRPAETLTAHLSATHDAALLLRARIGVLALADAVMAGRFWTIARWAALAHDAGKVADGFQEMIRGRVRNWGHRHEFLSLGFLPSLLADNELRQWVALGVATHHRPLTGDRSLSQLYGLARAKELHVTMGGVDQTAVRELTDWLRQTALAAELPVDPGAASTDLIADARQGLHALLDRWENQVCGEDGLAGVLLQGAVTMADHLSSAHGALCDDHPMDSRFVSAFVDGLSERGRTLYQHQQQAAETVGHMVVLAPTGSGKTETGLLWAAGQVADITAALGGRPRVFFTLPYLASINAITRRLGTLVEDLHLGVRDDIGVAHSRAGSYHLAAALADETCGHETDATADTATAARKATSRAAATRLFRELVRVGTPYQLMRGALAGAAHSSVLVDAANSVFILDELHAYEPRRLGYLLAMTGLWERLGGRVAVLSATLPEALVTLLTTTLRGGVTRITAPDELVPPRHRIRVRDRHLTDPETIDECADRLAQGRSVLVVANNVADARELFAALEPIAREHGHEAHLLHSRFRRMDRSRIEDALREFWNADRDERSPGLLVATQTVEVSLDVDFDCLFTSAAVLEALLQRFGRVNRKARRAPADVIIHTPRYSPRKNEEFADGVYPREPVEAALELLTAADGQTLTEHTATEWLNRIYDSTDWGRRWREQVLANQREFTEAFLTFKFPFDDRTVLAETFDRMFDGMDGLLIEDREDYTEALNTADGASGRLLAEEFLVPLPHWSAPLTQWDKTLGVRLINADYDPLLGLGEIHDREAVSYEPGVLI